MAVIDRKDALQQDDEEEESWLRRAVEGPARVTLPDLPRRGDVVDGKYRIEELLGRGGMGAVFLATHVLSEKPVALKWMLCSVSDDRARRRFVREARAVGRIDHPNVVVLYDVCQTPACSYLVMELLHGESLRARLARGRLEPAAAVELLVPAMRGVEAAHRVGVIHRDLKPDNIFLCESADGDAREAKVLDFGVSSIARLQGGHSTLTEDGALLGSPAYMSPEQIKDPHHVDHRTDIYAFGVILYEALTGLRPFEAPNYGALIVAINEREPKPLASARAGLPAGIEAVVLRTLARDPNERPASIAALIEALSPFASAGQVT